MYKAFFQIACMAYRLVLRDILKSSIENPESEWDDTVLGICDRIFNYTGKE